MCSAGKHLEREVEAGQSGPRPVGPAFNIKSPYNRIGFKLLPELQENDARDISKTCLQLHFHQIDRVGIHARQFSNAR